jgi:hypothetical protein
MKKLLMFVCLLTFVFYLSSISTFAQSRGSSHGPAVTGGHAPDINNSSDHGKSADHANTDHANAKNQSTGNTEFINRINANDKLNTRLTSLIPKDLATGLPIMSLTDAAAQFKNQGQFIAFLHVANNQKLNPTEWTNMRNAMTGTAPLSATGTAPLSATSTDKLSVGKALHLVRPNLSETEVSVQVEQAEAQSKEDLKTKPTS